MINPFIHLPVDIFLCSHFLFFSFFPRFYVIWHLHSMLLKNISNHLFTILEKNNHLPSFIQMKWNILKFFLFLNIGNSFPKQNTICYTHYIRDIRLSPLKQLAGDLFWRCNSWLSQFDHFCQIASTMKYGEFIIYLWIVTLVFCNYQKSWWTCLLYLIEVSFELIMIE